MSTTNYNLFFAGHPEYKQLNSPELKQKTFEQYCGKYKVKYNFYDVPFDYYSTEHKNKWHYVRPIDKPQYQWEIPTVLEIFDENNNIIQTKTTNYTPCINLYGDGDTLDGTYYTILENIDDKIKFNIYNLSNTNVQSFDISWYSTNVNIKIILHNNLYYVMFFDNNVLAIIKMDNIKNYICVSMKFYSECTDGRFILPLFGQNKMYVISIIDNIITFNNGKQSSIDNIEYEVSKFLLQGNPLYRLNLYSDKIDVTKYEKPIKHFVHNCGIFSAEYDYKDHSGRFDSNIGKFGSGTVVTFKENGEKLFELNSGCAPSIILHGDGKTREGTRFCIGGVTIYDFNQKLIRETQIGADSHHDIQRVNELYAISNSIEVCSWCNFFGIVDLDLFFKQEGNEEPTRPYDNARIHVPLNGDDKIYVTCADEDVLILSNGHRLKYKEAEDYDFSNGDGYQEYDFAAMRYSVEQIKQINDTILRGGTVYIPISDS